MHYPVLFLCQGEAVTFPGLPFTPSVSSPFNDNGEDVDVFGAVLDTETMKIMGVTQEEEGGTFSYVCQSCAYENFVCPQICNACQMGKSQCMLWSTTRPRYHCLRF